MSAYKRMSEVAKDAREKVNPAPAYEPLAEEHEELALKALLAFSGSPSAAAEAMKAQYGVAVVPEVLARMRDHTHAERYTALQEQFAPHIEEAMVRELRELARAAMHGERIGIENAVKSLPNLPPAVSAQIALNLSKIKTANLDKLLAMTGRPTTITENRSAEDIIRALTSKGVLELEAAT